MNDIGKPIYWDLETHIKAIIGMIRADEIQIALTMLDSVPGYYRDNYPLELTEIKKTLYQNLYDQIEYATDDEEADCTREFGEAQWSSGYMYPRAEIITNLIKSLFPRSPWIFDLGCSHGNLPLGLIKSNQSFTYYGVGMNHRIQQKVKGWVGEHWCEAPINDQPTILYCTEVLEHMMNPHDLVQSAYKVGVNFDHILLSVPKYTLGGGLENWDSRRLGHVRTYTPKEFLEFADKSFPGYKWNFYDAFSMVVHGSR